MAELFYNYGIYMINDSIEHGTEVIHKEFGIGTFDRLSLTDTNKVVVKFQVGYRHVLKEDLYLNHK